MKGHETIYGDGASLGQTYKLNYSSLNLPVDYIVASATSKSSPGSTSMLNFGAVCGKKRPGDSFLQSFEQEEIGDEYLDEYFNQPEKKKRLAVDQIQFLERSFELDNKLEPERKVQLAKELNLQPRQIAVWFQNRRARWKTRQLETDYEALHASYTSLKIDYDSLLTENEKLKAEVHHLKCNGAAMDTEKSISGSFDTEKLSESISKEAVARTISEDEETKVSTLVYKNEEQSSAKSDVTNVESPWLSYGSQSSMLGSGDSSRFFEADRSDLSQNGGDNLVEDLLLPDYTFLKIDDARCHMHVSSFYYGFPVEDHAFGFLSS